MGRLAQTLAITQYPYLQLRKSLLEAHKFGFPNSAALRRRLEVSSWLALRAVAQSARSVQSVAAQSAARRACSSNADPRRVVGQCNGRWQTARVVEEKQSSQPSQSERSAQFPAPVGKTNTETKLKLIIVCALRKLQIQCKRSRLQHCARCKGAG